MRSLKQASQELVLEKTLVISELQVVDVNMELLTFEGVDFTYDYMVVEEKKYRVPKTVQSQIKVLVNDNPELTKVKVLREGTTKNDTKYQVIPQ